MTNPDDVCQPIAAVSQTIAGHFLSIYAPKAQTWVRLLNRYGSQEAAERAADGYGFKLVPASFSPHNRPRPVR